MSGSGPEQAGVDGYVEVNVCVRLTVEVCAGVLPRTCLVCELGLGFKVEAPFVIFSRLPPLT